MKILSIDTASKICSVALLEDEVIVDEMNLDDGKTHSENLMPMVEEILSKNHVALSEIKLISCCTGPGSFTGIRIGVASAKAMAEVNQIPLASVTSLETLARMDDSKKTKAVLIDARNNQVYCGIFDETWSLIQESMADDIAKIMEQLKTYNHLICLGDGAMLHKKLIEQEIPTAEFSAENEQRAGLGGKIAYQKYLKKDLQNADTLVPLYLRKSQAERMKEKQK